MNIIAPRLEAEEKAASALSDHINKLDQPKVVLGVVGGTSVGGILSKLEVDWSKVEVFLVDERWVSPGDESSNFKVVETNLPLSAHVHPFYTEKGVAAYTKEFDSVGGAFDIVLLSAGEDGHVGSLFPNHPSIKDDAVGFIEVERSPKPPAKRMSASRKLIQTAKVGFVVFFGEGKKKALKQFNDKSVSITHCPAKLVKKLDEWHVVSDIL